MVVGKREGPVILSLCHEKGDEEDNLRDLLCGTCDIARLSADHALRQSDHREGRQERQDQRQRYAAGVKAA